MNAKHHNAYLPFLLILVSAVLALVACGSKADSDETDARGDVDAGGPDASSAPEEHPLQGLPSYSDVAYPRHNPDDELKAMLGKVLFWEEQIGEDDTMACGTCHRPSAGGSDPRSAELGARHPGLDGMLDPSPELESDDIRGAQGVKACTETDGSIEYADPSAPVQVTGRKPPSYLDAMFGLDLFWDGRASRDWADPENFSYFSEGVNNGAALSFEAELNPTTGNLVGYGLESQAKGPPGSDVEMACAGQTWSDIVEKLGSVEPLAKAKSMPSDVEAFIAEYETYPAMFAAVYGGALKTDLGAGDDEINTARVVFAIATHERTMTSNQTPWDRWNAGEGDALTARQVRGFELFMGAAKCSACHAPPSFMDNAYHFIGFHDPEWDIGRQAIESSAVAGSMKTPTLRNVGLREPGGLLHRGDGPGRDLEGVMRLYNDGGRRSDPAVLALIDPNIVKLNLSSDDIEAIIDFLRNGLTDPRAAEELPPFDRPVLGTEP